MLLALVLFSNSMGGHVVYRAGILYSQLSQNTESPYYCRGSVPAVVAAVDTDESTRASSRQHY